MNKMINNTINSNIMIDKITMINSLSDSIATDLNNSSNCQLLYLREQKERGNILVSHYNIDNKPISNISGLSINNLSSTNNNLLSGLSINNIFQINNITTKNG